MEAMVVQPTFALFTAAKIQIIIEIASKTKKKQ